MEFLAHDPKNAGLRLAGDLARHVTPALRGGTPQLDRLAQLSSTMTALEWKLLRKRVGPSAPVAVSSIS